MSRSDRVHGCKRLIIFDLDGVITSEEAYWDCGGLTLHELLYSPCYWGLSAETSPIEPSPPLLIPVG